ncbi:hypothetical protein BDZ97DRAFT_478458 [Flammula alnicola]|nr:hypothetical protein BDZ97DRAFT_478458 [Flammula alnicola]
MMPNTESTSPAVLAVVGSAKSALRRKRKLIKQKISLHKAETLAMKKALRTHGKKIHELNKALNRTSPFLAILPLDMISEIFNLAADSAPYDRNPFPFTVGQVCQAWRQIARSTPLLWRHITISFSEKNIESQEQLLREWIGRSAACPLELDLSCPNWEWEPPISTFLLLLECCNRWRTLNSRAFANLSLALNRGYSFPLLCSLSLSQYYSLVNKDVWAFNLPNQLRSLNIVGISPNALRIDWTSLHNLGAILSVEEWTDVLECCSSLKTCEAQFSDSEDEVVPISLDNAIHTLPHLTRLSINGSIDSVTLFLQTTLVPSVEHICLYFDSDVPIQLGTIPEIIGHSSRCLKDLNIAGQFGAEAEEDIINMLGQLPSIERLVLRLFDATLSDLMINQLDPRLHSGFLPNLTEFSYLGKISFEPELMLGMMEARLDFFESGRKITDPSGVFYTMCQLDTIKITYTNAAWVQERDPNRLMDFYRKLVPLSSRGTTLSLTWEEYDGGEDNS